MKKLLYISAAALLMFAGACDKVLNTVLVVDETYDTKNLDKTVTVLPGVTVAFEQEIKFEIGQLLGEATGEGSFLKVAGSTDPIFDEGDLMFRQDANSSNINPDVATLYDAAAGKAEFQNSIAVYMVDVPGMLNVSNKYTLSNPCFRLQLTSDWLQPLVMDVTMSVAGISHNISGIPVQALASQTIYISAEGGFASDASESDFILAVIGEETGFTGLLLLFALIIFIVIRGIKTAARANDFFAYLTAIGISAVFGIQSLVNALVVTGSIPPTGLPLPLVSAGNTSLIVFMFSFGVLFNISRTSGNN